MSEIILLLITYVNILHDIDLTEILSQTTDTNTVTTIAPQVLDNDISAIRLERNAVVAIINVRILDDNVVGPICVPAILKLEW